MDEKTQEHYLLQNDGGLLSGLQHNALAPLVLCVGGRHRSIVGSVLEFSHLYLVFVVFTWVHPYLKWSFTKTFSPSAYHMHNTTLPHDKNYNANTVLHTTNYSALRCFQSYPFISTLLILFWQRNQIHTVVNMCISRYLQKYTEKH